MGIIKHFEDNTPWIVDDNPNLYFPTSPDDWLKNKTIRKINKWYVCFEEKVKIAKFKELDVAVRWLSER